MQRELNVCLLLSENPNFNAIVSIQGLAVQVSWNALLGERETAMDDLHAACTQDTMISMLRNDPCLRGLSWPRRTYLALMLAANNLTAMSSLQGFCIRRIDVSRP
jgi:hypothetical protein